MTASILNPTPLYCTHITNLVAGNSPAGGDNPVGVEDSPAGVEDSPAGEDSLAGGVDNRTSSGSLRNLALLIQRE